MKEEHLQRILEVILKDGHAKARDLAWNFGVSEITIRRDLNELAKRGVIRRAHGGAIISSSVTVEPPLIQRIRRAYVG